MLNHSQRLLLRDFALRSQEKISAYFQADDLPSFLYWKVHDINPYQGLDHDITEYVYKVYHAIDREG